MSTEKTSSQLSPRLLPGWRETWRRVQVRKLWVSQGQASTRLSVSSAGPAMVVGPSQNGALSLAVQELKPIAVSSMKTAVWKRLLAIPARWRAGHVDAELAADERF